MWLFIKLKNKVYIADRGQGLITYSIDEFKNLDWCSYFNGTGDTFRKRAMENYNVLHL